MLDSATVFILHSQLINQHLGFRYLPYALVEGREMYKEIEKRERAALDVLRMRCGGSKAKEDVVMSAVLGGPLGQPAFPSGDMLIFPLCLHIFYAYVKVLTHAFSILRETLKEPSHCSQCQG